MQPLEVTIIQADLVWENPLANRKFFEKEIKNISNKVDLIVLPEMFTTGFTMNASTIAEKMNGNTINWMQQLAKEKNAAITGSIVITENDRFYNRLLFVFPSGKIEHYDKRHTFTLAGENKEYTAGKDKLIANYKGWKICPLICYDLRFPVWARNIENYDLLLYVANWPKQRIAAWDTLLQARAIENMSYVIGVNRVGKDANNYEYPGNSAIVDCLGKVIKRFDNGKNNTVSLTLDHGYQEKIRERLGFLKDKDEFKITK